MYSFDKNYYSGAFSSIYSLLYNFDPTKIDELNLNICIEEEDLQSFIHIVSKFREKKCFNYILYILNKTVLDNSILNTKCYKGGNHLLKTANFNRLICGHIITCNHLLYLDSDTIVKSDLSNVIDNIPNNEYIIMGKKSELLLKNLLNVNNIEHAKLYIENNEQKNVIYTGTLLINPNRFREHYQKMIELVNVHNTLKDKGGLYKLFTMSIINITLINDIIYFDSFLNNIVDLGCKKDIEQSLLERADVLDWSGIYKPWFNNGMYKEFWKKYDVLLIKYSNVETNKNTVESF